MIFQTENNFISSLKSRRYPIKMGHIALLMGLADAHTLQRGKGIIDKNLARNASLFCRMLLSGSLSLSIYNLAYASDRWDEYESSSEEYSYTSSNTSSYVSSSTSDEDAEPYFGVPYRGEVKHSLYNHSNEYTPPPYYSGPFVNKAERGEVLYDEFSSLRLNEGSSRDLDTPSCHQYPFQNRTENKLKPWPVYNEDYEGYANDDYDGDLRVPDSRRPIRDFSHEHNYYRQVTPPSHFSSISGFVQRNTTTKQRSQVSSESGIRRQAFLSRENTHTDTNRLRCASNKYDLNNDSLPHNKHNRNKTKNEKSKFEPINIPVYFHHIMDSRGNGKLGLNDRLKQIKVLNEAYGRHNINFTWDKTMVTEDKNDSWFSMEQNSEIERQAKEKLWWNPEKCLNLYTCQPTDENKEILGWATFPWELKDDPKKDGVVILHSTFPGGTHPYNLGKTTIHESGHWLGLFHTFENGCKDNGDEVDDTPPHAGPNYSPEGKKWKNNACKKGETAPYYNYMNYAEDAYMTQFTEGQIVRIFQQTNLYRKGLFSNY